MPAPFGRRRALLAGYRAAAEPADALPALFRQSPLCECWELVAADDTAHARVLLHHNAFDAVLLDQPVDDWTAGLQDCATVVQLTQFRPEALTRACQDGVTICLPRDMTLAHPPLLEAALEQAARLADERRLHALTIDQLEQSRRRIDRLVSLIWRSSPAEPNTGWLAERYILERLDEELARAQRHAAPFTLAIGEVLEEDGHQELPDMHEWTATTVHRAKRRCDVAGQYGPNRFLLLMVHTPQDGALTCCRRLQRLLQACPPFGGPREAVRAYFGLAASAHGSTPSLLRAAEENLQTARNVDDGIAVAS